MPGPSGGGPGPQSSSSPLGSYRQAALRLNNAQIKALPSTGVLFQITRSPNQIIWPVTIVAGCNSIAGAYTGITADDSTLAISWMTATTPPTGFDAAYFGINDTNQSGVSQLLGSAVHHVVLSTTQVNFNSDWLAPSGSVNEQPSDVAGVDLGVYSGNGDGDFTAGNVANYMAIGVTYLLYNTFTGAFE